MKNQSFLLAVVLVVALTGCLVDLPENQPPYPVTGPTPTPGFTAYTNADQFYQLQIAEVGGQRDPDGDQVFFRSTALPVYMLLDADTGLVTILGDPTFAGPPAGEVVVDFWGEDEHGADTSGTPYVVRFTFVGDPPENQPPYPVTGPTQTPEFTAYTNADQFYQLQIAEVSGQRDPDGDQVFFRSTALPGYMELHADTGLVTIKGEIGLWPPEGIVVVDFWSEDEHGADTSGTPYVVTFTFEST